MWVGGTAKLVLGGVACLVLIAIVVLFAYPAKTKEEKPLKDLLAGLRPGMTMTQVMSAIPRQLLVGEERSTNVMWRTVLVPQQARVESSLSYTRNPQSWRPLGAVEFTWLYFDSNQCLVGIYYDSSYYNFDPLRLPQWQAGSRKE
jgi:hypothetical protein